VSPDARCPSSGSELAYQEGSKEVLFWTPNEAGEESFEGYVCQRSGNVHTIRMQPEAEGYALGHNIDFVNSVFEVDIRTIAGQPSDTSAAIELDGVGEMPYALMLSLGGKYSIERYEGSEWTPLIEGEYSQPTQQTTGQSIHVALVVTSIQTQVIVNGEQVVALPIPPDEPWQPWATITLGLGAITDSPGGATVEFSHPTLRSICDWDPRYELVPALEKGLAQVVLYSLLAAATIGAGWSAISLWRQDRLFQMRDAVLLSMALIAGVIVSSSGPPSQAIAGGLLSAGEIAAIWLLLRFRTQAPGWPRLALGFIATLVPGLLLARSPDEEVGLALTQGYWLLLQSGFLLVSLLRECLRVVSGSPAPYDSPSFHFSIPATTVWRRRMLWEIFVPVLWFLFLPLWTTASHPGGPAGWYTGTTIVYSAIDALTMAATTALEAWAFCLLLWPTRQLPFWLRSIAFLPVGLLGAAWAVAGVFGFDLPLALFTHGLWFAALILAGIVSLVTRLAVHRRELNSQIGDPTPSHWSRRGFVLAAFPIVLGAAILVPLYANVPANTAASHVPVDTLAISVSFTAATIGLAALVDWATRKPAAQVESVDMQTK